MRWAAALACLTLASCGSTQQAGQQAQSRWLGRPVDEFFRANGPPGTSYTEAGGGRIFAWEASGTASNIKLICSASLTADALGKITAIQLRQDSIGAWNTSRCSEIFS